MPGAHWTMEELELLLDTDLTLADVAEMTGRPLHGVENRASRLGIRRHREKWVPPPPLTDRVQWSEEELLVLLDMSLSFPEIARRTGRSYDSVKIKARKLGVHRRRYWAQPGYKSGADDYRGQGWRDIRQDILERDGFTCQDGHEYVPSSRGLVVHHEIPWRLYPVNDPRFLVTLCRSQHMQRPEHAWRTIPTELESLLG